MVNAQFSSFTLQDASHNSITSLSATQTAAIAAVEASLSLAASGTNVNSGSVNWSYDLPDKMFDFLPAGETLTLYYTATVDDMHGGVASKPLSVTITGANDLPVVLAETDPPTQAIVAVNLAGLVILLLRI